MVSHLFFSQLMFLGLLWLCVMLHYAWPNECTGGDQKPSKPLPPPRQRSRDLKPFPGLTRTPPCAACAQAHAHEPQPPWAYRGGVGLGNMSANGHPNGGPWRQLYCSSCGGYALETHGTLFHCKRVAPDVLVWAVGALAAGLGLRAVARVFEVDPHTVLIWFVEVAEHAAACSPYFLHAMRVTQVQLEERFARLSAVQAGAVSEAEAITQLSRSPHWVGGAMDPVSQLLLAIDVGNRPLAMAQRVVHQVVQVLAPDCAPLFLTDGLQEYRTALLTH